MCMVYENLRSAKVSKSFPRRALTGKLIEDTFFHFEIKNGFYLYVYRKNNQGQPFFKIILATPITRKWDIKTHTYTSFKGPKTSKLDVKLLVKSHK